MNSRLMEKFCFFNGDVSSIRSLNSQYDSINSNANQQIKKPERVLVFFPRQFVYYKVQKTDKLTKQDVADSKKKSHHEPVIWEND